MKHLPTLVLLLMGMFLAPWVADAADELVTCSTVTGQPLQAEFRGDSPAGVDGASTSADGQKIREAVDKEVKEYLASCRDEGFAMTGGVKLLDGKTLGTCQKDAKGADVCAWREVSTKPAKNLTGAPGTALINSYNLDADGKNVTATASFEVYYHKDPSNKYRGRAYRMKKLSDGNWEMVSGPTFPDTCQAKQRQLNDARAVALSQNPNMDDVAKKKLEADDIVALRSELITICAQKRGVSAEQGNFGSILGRRATEAEQAITNKSISCNHLLELFVYANGGVCLDDQANYTFSTQRVGSGLSVLNVIQRIMGLLATSIGSVAMLVMIIGGFMMITAGANEDMISRGKLAFTYGAIGIIVVFSSYLLVVFVQSLFFT